MIEFRVTAKTEKVQQNLRAAMKKDADEVYKLLTAVTLDIEGTAKRLIAEPKSGEPARSRRNPNNIHIRSKPGQAPANDTGILLRNIRSKVRRVGTSKYVAEGEVISSAHYSKYLELGIGMEARPFMRPAVERNYPKFMNGIRKILNRNR